MRCEDVRAALSERLDLGTPLPQAAEAHVEGCGACRRFSEASWRLRQSLRLSLAEPVPDLVPAVVARLEREAAAGEPEAAVAVAGPRPVPPLREEPAEQPPLQLPPPSRPRRSLLRTAVAAMLAGVLVGSAVASGALVPRRRPETALAAEIPARIAAAAPDVTAYAATFELLERNWRPEVPERRFRVEVGFRAPERLRVHVRDLTRYPRGLASPNDSTLEVAGDRWSLVGREACTPEAAPTCGAVAPIRRAVVDRPPFDADAAMPTDVVLPVTTLAGSSRVAVLGERSMLGRAAVGVALTAQDAAPLFAFFRQSGSWRPLYPSDPVALWLDRETWLPLRATVTASPSPDRPRWSSSYGLGRDRPGDVVLDLRATSVSLEPEAGPPGPPAAGPDASSRGFEDLALEGLEQAVGYAPLVPSELAGLRPHRFGRFAARPREAVLSFARGLNWLEVRQTRSHGGGGFFGDVGSLAQRVAVPGGGVGYYEPASGSLGRRLALHADGWDLYLETNLPRERLLGVAGSLGIRGTDPPDSWRVRRGPGDRTLVTVSPARAATTAGFPLLLPAELPPGYGPVAAQVATVEDRTAATLYYRRPGLEEAPFGIRLHQAPGEPLPPGTGTDEFTVELRGSVARWSPERHELEWVEPVRGRPTYVSIRAPGLELGDVAALARSLEVR